MTTQDELAKVRGKAPEKRPTVRALATATAHNDCTFARLALATRTNLDQLCDDTYFAVDFGQDPQAFQRGEMFERRVKDKDYAVLIQLLREKAGFALTDVRIRDLRSGAIPNEIGLKHRAAETRQLLKMIAHKAINAPNIIDGAVLTCTIAGRTAYFEADGLAAASDGKLHVAEVKSFPITDGRCDNDKLGTACEQAAWYVLLCRRALIELKLSPDAVSDEGFIILPMGVGLTPTLLIQNLAARVRRADRLLASTPTGDDMLMVASGLQFPASNVDPQARLDTLEQMMDKVGTNYRPDCLQDCGMGRLCRGRAQTTGLATLCGSSVVRLLPGVRTLPRAAELADGASPAPTEVHAAAALVRANSVFNRVLIEGAL
ncbi:MAG: hypothetical protein DVS81_16440 [Candidatus Accumulibacter meliphilus]|jgi:hypothetical protein|uniref:Uncharacterized protein n=1 Tax=Candidatus Accumulibacter meliphilus TaxID=2211374 RepID=A0A369XKX9_9PROT|nr:MAG: hypothetical protein DVS81_16440 [Candidatus Accumulibacter meliphilus]